MEHALDWWRGAVIYQIYPRSFHDANGDGTGDLAGITRKLPYVASLGVDAVWISPFFKSPMKDGGYDIADYRAIDPLFGTMEDFDRLIAEARRLGLKVLIDQVCSHTSDQHPWFLESRSSRDNPKADFYVWVDPRPDGTPPNNWLSVFGGGAWTWEPRRGQYYLHNFLVSQPDLNFHNPRVRRAMLDELAFWLDRGVSGVRLDAINFCFHDALLRDNPPRPPNERPADTPLENPYAHQIHLYDKTRPEVLGFLEELRALVDRYPGVVTLGEIGADDALQTAAQYSKSGLRLNMTYTFELLSDRFGAARVRFIVESLEACIEDGWHCWAFSNHDVPRAVTRWGGPSAGDAFAKLLMALLLSLRGTVCLYQGEELGLPEADVPFERLRDPYGIHFWPAIKGRDGARTPMPWSAEAAHAGFSEVEPWLPVVEEHRRRAVDLQERTPDSVLHAYRRFLAFRRQHPALRSGAIRFFDAPPHLLVFEREGGGERVLAAFNLGPAPAELPTKAWPGLSPLSGHGFGATARGDGVEIDGFGAFFGLIGSTAGAVP
jgi:alpha-glucosidase